MALLMVTRSMQNDPVVSKASELLRLGLMPSVDAIKAGQVGQPTATLLNEAHVLLPTELA